VIEAINGKLQLARKRAGKYRGVPNLRALSSSIPGDLQVASKLAKPFSDPF